MYNRAAARVNEPSSTTARKYSSCLSSTTDRLRPPSRDLDHQGGARPDRGLKSVDLPMGRHVGACHIRWVIARVRVGARTGGSPCRRSVMPENAVAGRDVAEIALVVAQRTVAAHVEHVLGTLMTPTRTLAEVR